MRTVILCLLTGTIFGLGGFLLGGNLNQGVLDTYTTSSLGYLERERDSARNFSRRLANGEPLETAYSGETGTPLFEKAGYLIGELASIRLEDGQAVELCFEPPEVLGEESDCQTVRLMAAEDISE